MSIERYFLVGLGILAAWSGLDSWSKDRKAESLAASCYAEMSKATASSPDPKTLTEVFHCDKVGE